MLVAWLQKMVLNKKERKEALDYHIPVTQLTHSEIVMRQLSALSIYGYVGGRHI